MNVSQQIVSSGWFQFFTWFTIGSALAFNCLGVVVARKDKLFGARHFHTFLPISFMALFWFVSYSLYFFGEIDRQQYLNLVSPIAPVAFLVVWVLPPVAYFFETRARKKLKK